MHFEKPEGITSAAAPTPFLSMDQMDIARRIMAKGLLKKLFIEIGVKWYDGPQSPPDNHGEFGWAKDWNDQLERTLIQKLGEAQMERVRDNLAVALATGFTGTKVSRNTLNDFVKNELIETMSKIVKDPELGKFDGLAHRLTEGALLPMFGMPSRIRYLFHGEVNASTDKIPCIDRELDLAVSEFAPSSQRTKDKYIHESYGICPPLVIRREGKRTKVDAAGGPHDEPFLDTFWIRKCTRCRHIHRFDGTEKPLDEEFTKRCDECDAGNPECTIQELRVPAGFYTKELSLGENASEGADIVVSPAARISDFDSTRAFPVAGINMVHDFKEKQRLYTLNDNKGELFRGISIKDPNIRFRQGSDGDINRWIPSGQSNEDPIALVAPKTTDALVFRLGEMPRGLDADPIIRAGVRAGVNSALWSAAFLIRSTAADEMDIDPEEFDLCQIRRSQIGFDKTGRSRFSGEFIIADHLANGSGFTRQLHKTMMGVIGRIVETADGRREDGVLGKIFSNDHAVRCDTACFSCLQNFRNMRYHSILDWRLGLSAIRMFKEPGYQAGLDDVWVAAELRGWKDKAREFMRSFTKNLGQEWGMAYQDQRQVPCIEWNDQTSGEMRRIIVRHSLWDMVNPQGIFAQWIADSAAVVGIENMLCIDFFDLARRPSWVFQTLMDEEQRNKYFRL
jgi:hypothetical protein